MRITLITQYYPPESGAVMYGRHLAVGLAARGHCITAVVEAPHFPTGRLLPGYQRFVPQMKREDGVQVLRLPLVMGSNTQHVRRMLGFLTFSTAALMSALLRSRPDVIIASVPPATSAAAGWAAARIQRCPFVALLRDIEPWRALKHRDMHTRRIGRLLISAFSAIYRNADRIVVMHEREIESLSAVGVPAGRVVVIPHGVDLSLVSRSRGGTIHLRRRPGRLLLLYTGTIGLVHGLPALLRTMADPLIRSLPVDLAIVGDGQFRGECEQVVDTCRLENVTFYPPVEPAYVGEHLSQADVLVCSFRNDDDIPLCSKFYEYCASGKPILVHGKNLAGAHVAEIGNGTACYAGRVEDLHLALRGFIDDYDTWMRRGLLGRDYAMRHFSQSSRDEQWVDLIDGLVHRR